MTDEAFDQVFGRGPAPRKFTDRIAPNQPFGGRSDPIAAMAVEASTAAPIPGEYKAFGYIPAGTINQSCEVRSWVDGTDVPDGVVFFYRLLLGIDFTGTTELRLKLPDSIVVLSGRDLDPLRQQLTRQLVTFVQQFSKRVWHHPCAQGETLIERIEIVRP